MAVTQPPREDWIYVGGLVATGLAVWVTSGGRNLGLRLIVALVTGLGVLAWSAVVALTVWLVFRHLNPGEKPRPFPTPAIAVWFAPATIVILDFSVLQVVAGIAIAVGAARLLCMPTASGGILVPAPARHFYLALMVGIGIEAAGVALVLHYHFRAAALVVVTAAVLVALIIGRGAWTFGSGVGARRRWAVALPVILLLAMIARPVPNPRGHSGAATAEAAGPAPGRDGGGTETDLPANPGASLPGPYSGVILWPEVQPVTLLIDPMLVGRGALASATRPLTIPFGGEYWMYRTPLQRPPRHSFFKRGTPVALHFETTDRAQLQMEARQKLTRLLSTGCCSRVEVAILNADKCPGTISLELSLMNGDLPGMPPLGLGAAMVSSVSDGDNPIPETLSYHFPPSPYLREFDTIRMVFHMAVSRADQSARVAIQRFVFIPH